MKRISMLLAAMILVSGITVKSQAPAAASGPDYSGLEKKIEKSNNDIQNEKKNTKAKTWTSRVDVFVDVYNVYNDVLQRGLNKMLVTGLMGTPKEVQTMKDGDETIEIYVYDRVNLKLRNETLEDWTETEKLYEDPLSEAITALDKAVELNTDGKADKDIEKSGSALKTALADKGSVAYSDGDFETSYEAFSNIIPIVELPQVKALGDTMDVWYIYYAGRTAIDVKKYNEAIQCFDKAEENNFESPFVYVYEKQAYFGIGDTAQGIEVIREGFNKYPDNQSIMIELINYYLTSNKTDEALELIQVAKEGDPTNPSYAFTEGSLLDKAGRFDEAEAKYMEAISMNPEYFDANYNLAVLYYNQAVKLYDAAALTSDNEEFQKLQSEGNDELAKAIPYMEKASEINPDERSTWTVLRQIYYRLKDGNPELEQKYENVVNKLNEM